MNKIEKAIEYLKNARIDYSNVENGIKAQKVCDLAISALTEKLNGGWVKCEDGLPEVCGHYIVSCKNDYGYEFVSDDFFRERKFEAFGKIVIAWQPLPSPYQPIDTVN